MQTRILALALAIVIVTLGLGACAKTAGPTSSSTTSQATAPTLRVFGTITNLYSSYF